MSKIAAIYMLTNASGRGPGHSAITFGAKVYSFEPAAPGSMDHLFGDSWKIFDTRKYVLEINPSRPALVQELNGAVGLRPLGAYLMKSIQDSQLYAARGVCSDQAAAAISAGTEGAWAPRKGLVTTPKALYDQLIWAGLVTRTYYYWPLAPKAAPAPDSADARILNRLRLEHAGVPQAPMNTGILSWGNAPLPTPTPAPAPPATPASDYQADYPVFKAGIMLSNVSNERYQTFEYWPLIYDDNRALLPNGPNKVPLNIKLKIRKPEKFTAAELAHARKHWKNWQTYR